MMEIDAFSAGYAQSKDKKRGGAAVILHAVGGPMNSIEWSRKMTFPLGPCTSNLAAIKAADIALLSIKKDLAQSSDVTLYVDNTYVVDMLSKSSDGKYASEPRTNVDDVMSLRKQYDSFARINLVCSKDNQTQLQCLDMAKVTAINQTAVDSGTKTDEKDG